jgi:hypothetical protein
VYGINSTATATAAASSSNPFIVEHNLQPQIKLAGNLTDNGTEKSFVDRFVSVHCSINCGYEQI